MTERDRQRAGESPRLATRAGMESTPMLARIPTALSGERLSIPLFATSRR
jgi:hypothetical protein